MNRPELCLLISLCLLVACQGDGATALGPQGPADPLVPAGPPCDKNPDHPTCSGGGDDGNGGGPAATMANLERGYMTPAPMPITILLRENGAQAEVNFQEKEEVTIDFDPTLFPATEEEIGQYCRGSWSIDGVEQEFTSARQAELWNTFPRSAVRNYFAKVWFGKNHEFDGQPHERHRTHGRHYAVDPDTGHEVRWNYRVGDSDLWQDPARLATGAWDPADESITITGGLITFQKATSATGEKMKVACRNDAGSRFARSFVSNRCDNEDPAC